MDTKHCKKCGQDKSTTEFDRRRNGLKSYCKHCCNLIKKEARRNKNGYYATESKRRTPESRKRYRQRQKQRCMEHYASPPKCQKCGFSDIRALSIDHINGGGRAHRQSVKKIYRWLIRNNFPEGFQVLCMNCQFIKREENQEYSK